MDRPGFFRIVDVNVNRVAEGLRVMEDIARFVMEDEGVGKELKEIRHQLRKVQKETGCIIFRDSESDILKEYDERLEGNRKGLMDLLIANSRRVEEGLRVLEETSKLFVPEYSEEFKEYRFRIYNLEKIMYERLSSVCNP